MDLNRLKEIKTAGIYDSNVQKELSDYMKDKKFFDIVKDIAQKDAKDNMAMLTGEQVVDIAIDYLTNPDKFKKEVKSTKPEPKPKAKPKKVEKKAEIKPEVVQDIFSLDL